MASKCTFISKLCLLNYTHKSKHSVNSAVSGAISSEQRVLLKGQDFWEATAHTMRTACQQPPAGAMKDTVKHQETWEKRNHSWCDWTDQIWQTPCTPRRFVRRETGRSPLPPWEAQQLHPSSILNSPVVPWQVSAMGFPLQRFLSSLWLVKKHCWSHRLFSLKLQAALEGCSIWTGQDGFFAPLQIPPGQEASHGNKPGWEIQPAGSGNP